jgi:plastocyanin
MNGSLDPGETDTDCGGLDCNPCGPNQMCVVEEDCEGGDCNSGMTCEENCEDGVQNGDEAAVDCGVGCLTGCDNSTPCDMHADCASGYCDATSDQCETPDCTDGVQNGDETDEDCGGGGLCDPCGPNQMCVLDSDCEGDDCNGSNTCEPNCEDGVQNNSEVDVDCGPGCGPCGNGQDCGADAHCDSEICYEGVCIGSLNGCSPSTATDRTGMATVSIVISGFSYSPPCVRMTVGSTFQSEAAPIHPFVGGRINGGAEAPSSSGPLAGSTTASTPSFTMSTTGSFGFYCDNHGTTSAMMGAVFVVP